MGTSQQVAFHYYSQTVEVPQQQTIWGRLMGLVGGYGHACGDVPKVASEGLGVQDFRVDSPALYARVL